MKGKHTKQPHLTPLAALKDYTAKTIASFEHTIAHAQTSQERRDARTTCNIMLWEVDTAQKYRIKPSALAMIAHLKPEQTSRVLTLPGTGIWMMLDDAQSTNLYFSCIPHAVTSYLESHPREIMPQGLSTIAPHQQHWNLEITALGHHPLSYVYDAELGRWTLNTIDLCPTGRCELLGGR
ncbi:hypothetical protein [Dictyobacter formicarum]|uniref:Uncharacterized protein n=1 Tax=Dictyobacter formicarum TaxID=2778368 RepID=A0ABQ3VN55_9CHLR|nr:hypothetical protein [Dictyobacter formicarum]GHO87139.1 hypothetical protein KSZ_51450 [Dictyobacter formicarum]